MSTSALKAAATGQATPQEARNPYEHLKRQLETSKGEFAKLVGSAANAEKFIRVVLNSVLANPELIDATRSSLVGACMRAAQDGLMPDGREAVLNIYNVKITDKSTKPWTERWEKRAQYLPMVGGLVKKMYASGEVTYVDAAVVYRGDVFKFQRGDDPKLVHEPALEYEEADLDVGGEPRVIAAYAVVKLKNGETKREVLKRIDIDKIMKASKAFDRDGNPTGPWKTWFDQMAIKSVLKRINKQLPHSDAFEALAQYDNEAMGFTSTPTSVADIAAHAAERPEATGGHEGHAALEDNPSPTLGQQMPHQGELSPEEIERRDADHDRSVKEAAQSSFGMDGASVDRAREEHAGKPSEHVRKATSKEAPLPEGVVEPNDKAIATAVEAKMRAAKTREELDLCADGGRRVKDKALRLRLDEIYENEVKRFEGKV